VLIAAVTLALLLITRPSPRDNVTQPESLDYPAEVGSDDPAPENPVREAYYKYSGSKFVDLASHDQMTILYGVRGTCNYFSKTSSGTGSLPSGFKWEMKTRNDSVIEALLPSEAYARIVEDLMVEAPKK
jgi:hypothetical protein